MKTVTQAVFVQMLEGSELEWPPFQAGTYIYSRATGGDVSKVGRELYRTAVP